MTATRIAAALVAPQAAREGNPLPSTHLAATADLAIRAALALMPFSAIAWLFIAH